MEKVLVGLSGGVDSSVCAILLKQKGYQVIGATMKLLDGNTDDVQDVCNKLGIEYLELDYTNEFKNEVIDYFANEYNECRTPNPCVVCNKKFKFGKFYEYARDNGIKYIATGHYAKIEYSEEYNRYVLRKSNNLEKDQSYFLYNIDKNILPYVLFPLSDYDSKDEIRGIARMNNMSVHSKSDSQDICFIQNDDYKKFLVDNNYVTDKPGDIVLNGMVIGKHSGLYKYTIGQRKGLGLSYKEPLYVIGMDKDKNELYVGFCDDLYTKTFRVRDYNLLLVDEIKEPILVDVKVRYKSIESKAYIRIIDDYIEVTYVDMQRGVTPGQSAVFYVGDIVLGGGIIV